MLLSEAVNIKKYPKVAEEAKRDEAIVDCITRGDAHGNAMLLVFTLIKEGLLELTEEAYAELWAIYEASGRGFTTKGLDRFKAILADGTYHPDACRLRLLGDLFADRGNNDALTLAVFEAMSVHKIQYDVIYSNHDHDFVRWLRGLTDSIHYDSLRNLQYLFSSSRGIFSKEDVSRSFNQFVLTHIKLIDYHFSPDENPLITLFTHAPVGLETVAGAAMQLGVAYDESTAELLAASIDRINAEFKRLLQRKDSALMRKLDDLKNPLDHLIWNRTGEPCVSGGRVYKTRRDNILVKHVRYEPSNTLYKVQFVHGHDGAYTPRQSNRINIDGDLGKASFMSVGPYMTFRQHMRPELAAVKVADVGLSGGTAVGAGVPLPSLFAPSPVEPPVDRGAEEVGDPAVPSVSL